MRLVFLGTPEEAVPPLEELGRAGHDVALVVTQPDRRRARGGGLLPSPVKQAAGRLGLPVLEPRRAGDVLEAVRDSGADLGVVVAFGQLIPQAMLDALPGGFVNVHFSLLPRWRGAAPVERALLAGDRVTGVCLIRLEAGLDTGPVYARQEVAIGPEETAGELRRRLVAVGTALLLANLDDLLHAHPVPQEGEATYAAKLTVEEFRLDWSRPAEELALLVRAGNPRPGAWTTAAGRRLKVLRGRAEAGPPDGLAGDPGGGPAGDPPPGTVLDGPRVVTGGGLLVLDEVQPEGRAAMDGRAWMAGLRGGGAVLGADGPRGP